MRLFIRFIALAITMAVGQVANAATYTVNNTTDSATDGSCSALEEGNGCTLREAIESANGNEGEDNIEFDSVVFATPQTIQLSGTPPYISSTVSINGPTAPGAGVTVQGVFTSGASPFTVLEGTTTLSNLSITGSTIGVYCFTGAATVINCALIGNEYGIWNYGSLTVRNCTLSGNTTRGIYNMERTGTAGVAVVESCTVTGSEIGVWNGNESTLSLSNSIVAGNQENIFSNLGIFNDLGHNIVRASAEQAGLDPQGPQDNGGPTKTIALLPGSPAIDTGSTDLMTDQRGLSRPGGIADDSGAYELQVTPTLQIDAPSLKEGSSGTTPLVFTLTLSVPSPKAITVVAESADAPTASATVGRDYYVLAPTMVTFSPGETSKTVRVRVRGDLLDEDNEFIALKVSSTSDVILPEEAALGTIIDDDGPPALSINDASTKEGNSASHEVTFTVSLSGPSINTVQVNYATARVSTNSATEGLDFTTQSGTLSFAPGQVSKGLKIVVLGDKIDEDDERFQVQLGSPQNAKIADKAGLCTILDDDAAPTFSIKGIGATEGGSDDANPATLRFEVKLSAANGRVVKVRMRTVPGTLFPATSGVDYKPLSITTLSFAPGETTKLITVAVKGDARIEDNEQVALELSSPTNAQLGAGATDGKLAVAATITDDEAKPSLSISSVSLTEGHGGTKAMVFGITLSAPSEQEVTVGFSTAEGAALSGSDFLGKSGSLTFAPGQTTQNLTVSIIGDRVPEPDEKFLVKLSKALNAVIIKSTGVGVILNDDVSATATGANASSAPAS